MKHTPGPWRVIKDSLDIVADPQPGLKGRFIAEALESIIRKEGEPIDAIFVQEDLEAHANAHLIAAAPDLLECLKNCLPCVMANSAFLDLKDQVINTIKKAQGGYIYEPNTRKD